MVKIALHTLKSTHLSLIERDTHYKIKYKDQFTFLKIYLYSKIDAWSQENGFIKLSLKDPTTIHNIQEFDRGISDILKGDYAPILCYENGETFFYLTPQTETLRLYQTKPSTLYLNLKMIRKAKYNPKVNRAIIYISE